MLKVFLVEDEYVLRKGIQNNIDWGGHGYEFCGEASDGELALPMIQKLKPDIVITDIRMPFMDGLTLSKLIKKEMPYIEIILLSGYEEFEYAKEGIRIGIAEYLLKPISGEDLLKVVDNLAEKVREKKKEREIQEKFVREMEENFMEERKKLFQHMVTGRESSVALLERAGTLNVDLSAMWYNILLVKTQSMNHVYNEYSNTVVKIEEELKKLDDGTNVLLFDRSPEGKAFVFKADSEPEMAQLLDDYINRLKEILKNYDNIRYFGGFGEAVNRLSELPVCYEKASHAFAHRYLVSESCILSYTGTEADAGLREEQFCISDVNPKQVDRSRIIEFLKLGNKEECKYFVEEFFKNMGANVMKSNIFRQYIIMDTYFCVADFVEGLRMDREEIETPEMTGGIMQSRESAMEYIVRIMERALELREGASGSRYDAILDEVMHYIEQNYADEELSLNELASHVNFSPNHLSMIFSQQTGKTFIKYLTDYRMNKAKELLRCSSKRSSEISVEVGYKDPHYFSYLFKKLQGMTPTQYREEKNLREWDK